MNPAHSPDIPSKSKACVGPRDLLAGLVRAGLGDGDVVLVHSSLSSFGQVVGGADAVIDALLGVVGPQGTIVVPTFTWGCFHDKRGATFDVLHSASEVGKITEVLRKRPGAFRSPHICHSVAAIGPRAPEMTRETASPYLEGSAFEALIRLDAWNLFLGVGFGSCTALHVVEEQLRVPYRTHRDFGDCSIVHADGQARPCISTEYLRKPGYFNDFAKMEKVFADRGALKTTRVGDANVKNIRIRDVIQITRDLVERDWGYLLTRPG